MCCRKKKNWIWLKKESLFNPQAITEGLASPQLWNNKIYLRKRSHIDRNILEDSY